MKKKKTSWYEEEFSIISKEIRKKNQLSYFDFLRIRNYKLNNVTKALEDEISKCTKEAFELVENGNIKGAVEKLITLSGVRIPIASAILAMRFPEKCAIIDRVVIEQLGKKEWLKRYLENTDIYIEYLELLKKKRPKNKSLREFELELWEKGRK